MRVRWVIAVAVVAGLAPGHPVAAKGLRSPACEVVTPSPAFRADRTAFCVYRDAPDAIQLLAVTTDGGRSWALAPAAGMNRDGAPALRVVLSPRYAEDGMLFATTQTGTYVSTDRGASFTLLDPLANDPRPGNPVAYLAEPLLPQAAPASQTVHLAYSDERGTARIDVERRLRLPAVGAPDAEIAGFVLNRWMQGPLALGYRGAGPARRAVAYQCAADLRCAESFEFPAGVMLGDLWAQPAPDRRSLLVRVHEADGSTQVWISRSGGASFHPWAEVQRLVDPANGAGARPLVSITGDPNLPRITYLRVSGAGRPAEQVFRSADMGNTWTRVAWAHDRAGPLPWSGPAPGPDGAGLYGADGGALFAIGTGRHAGTVHCSRDGGRRWSRFC